MLPGLAIALLVSASLAREPTRELRPSTAATDALDLRVRGVLDSQIRVRFPVLLNKEFTERRASPGGERVEVRGVLRANQRGEYVLRLALTETSRSGSVKKRSFSTKLTLEREETVCNGWVWWYGVRLSAER